MIEEKTYSITIHYRQVRDKRRALRTIARAVEELRDARIVAGSQTVTLMPKGGPDKGMALQRAQRMFHCDQPCTSATMTRTRMPLPRRPTIGCWRSASGRHDGPPPGIGFSASLPSIACWRD